METIIRHEGLNITILGHTEEKRHNGINKYNPHVTALSTVDLDSSVSDDRLRGDRQERCAQLGEGFIENVVSEE